MTNGPGASQFKSKNLFNKHFPSLFFLSRKNWQGGSGLLLEVGIIHGY